MTRLAETIGVNDRRDFRGQNLAGLIFRENQALQADFANCVLRGAVLCDSDFTHANFAWSDVSHANLRGCALETADFRGADLSGSCLQNVKARGAKFTGANLSGADLRGADLSWADCRGANFSAALFNDDTKLPLEVTTGQSMRKAHH